MARLSARHCKRPYRDLTLIFYLLLKRLSIKSKIGDPHFVLLQSSQQAKVKSAGDS